MFRAVVPRLADLKSGDVYKHDSARFVYHVTKLYNANQIIAAGFKLPAHRNARREMLGRGVYASYDMRKALQYVRDHDGHHYVLLKCRIVDGPILVVVTAGDALSRTWHSGYDGAVCVLGANNTNLNEVVLKDPTKLTVVGASFVDGRRANEDGWQEQAGPPYLVEHRPDAAFLARLLGGGAAGGAAVAAAVAAPAAGPRAALLAELAAFSQHLRAPEVARFLDCNGVVDWDCVVAKMKPKRLVAMRAYASSLNIVIDDTCMFDLGSYRETRMASIAVRKRLQKPAARPASPAGAAGAAGAGKRAATRSPSPVRGRAAVAGKRAATRSPSPVRGRAAAGAAARGSRSPSAQTDHTRAVTVVYRGRWSPGLRSSSPLNAPRSRSRSPDVPHEAAWRLAGWFPRDMLITNSSPVADLLDKCPVFCEEDIAAATRRKRASWDVLYTLLCGEVKQFLDACTGDDWAAAQAAVHDNQTHLLQREFDRLRVPGSAVLRQKLRNAVRAHTNATDAHVGATLRRQVRELTTYIADTVGSMHAHADWTAVRAQRLADTQLYVRRDMNFMRLWTVFRDYGSPHEHQRYANVVAQLLT